MSWKPLLISSFLHKISVWKKFTCILTSALYPVIIHMHLNFSRRNFWTTKVASNSSFIPLNLLLIFYEEQSGLTIYYSLLVMRVKMMLELNQLVAFYGAIQYKIVKLVIEI